MRELILKKCNDCGAIIKIIKDCECNDCGITCCGKPMKEIRTNNVDASIEKHKPTYEYNGDLLEVTVNHVMDNDHYIEWICLLTDTTEEYVYFKPGDTPKASFKKVESGKIYSYCNLHGLWVTDIK